MHLAIIPDGNRRWAKERGLSGSAGHFEGAKRIEEIISDAFDNGVFCLSVWGASVINLTERSKEEVGFLYGIFGDLFNKILSSKEIREKSVRVSVIGRWKEFFPEDLALLAEKIQSETAGNTGPRLNLMLAYSGTGDMREAFAKVALLSRENTSLIVDNDLIKSSLSTKDLPPVDLVIRMGGEPHWSDGFMMWDIANAQFYFTETFWPDFDKEKLREAISEFNSRTRRLGK